MSKGLSLQFLGSSTLSGLKNLSPFYNHIELDGDFSPATIEKLDSYLERPIQYSLCNCLSSSLTRSIAEQPQQFINEFKKHFESICIQAASHNIHSLSLDFSLDTTLRDDAQTNKRITLLKRISPILVQQGIHLTLPVRVPLIHPDIAEHFLTVLSQTMNPNIHISLDVHPHELGLKFAPSTFLKWLKYDISSVRFIYELDLGNHLVDKLLHPWLKFLASLNYRGTIIFAPHTHSSSQLLLESETLETMICKIEDEESK